MLLPADHSHYSNFRLHYMAYTLEMNLSFIVLFIGTALLLIGIFRKKTKLFIGVGALLIFLSILMLIYYGRGVL